MEKVKDSNFDFILTDINMPNSNGLTLLSDVIVSNDGKFLTSFLGGSAVDGKKQVQIPVIFMSGIFSQPDFEKFAGFQISDILSKPFTYNDFANYIKRYQAI